MKVYCQAIGILNYLAGRFILKAVVVLLGHIILDLLGHARV
jgi:hypothetical protein